MAQDRAAASALLAVLDRRGEIEWMIAIPDTNSRAVAPDRWASGAAYEPFIGRWSRLVARSFLTWLGDLRRHFWIDVGCGTGALTSAILESSPAHVLAIDASPAFASYARATIPDDRASFVVADARAIPFAADSAVIAASGLVLNFIPQPEVVVAEMARVTREGGVVAAYVWDYASGMQMLRRFWDAAVALDPEAAVLDEARRFPLCRPAALGELWRGAGLRDVETCALDVETRFTDFDDLWNPFLGGQGPAPTYIASLDDDARARLRERLRSEFPDSGSIALRARAWGVRGFRE